MSAVADAGQNPDEPGFGRVDWGSYKIDLTPQLGN
jgi:hypothetical protein